MANTSKADNSTGSDSEGDVFTRNFDDVLIAEHTDILSRRDHNSVEDNKDELRNRLEQAKSDRNAVRGLKRDTEAVLSDTEEVYARSTVFETIALALSGGGIRSGSFALGALQALASKDLLKRIDYISTVSGGGYTGIASTLAMNANSGVFPFATKDEYRDTDDMRLLRDNANYLKFGQFLPMLHNVVILLRGMLTNLVLVTSVLLLLASFTLWANPDIASLSRSGFAEIDLPFPGYLSNSAFGFTVLCAAAATLSFAVWALWKGIGATLENYGSFLSAVCSLVLIVLVLSAFFELQPWIQLQFLDNQTIAQSQLEVRYLKDVPSCRPSCESLMGDRIQDTFAMVVSDACARNAVPGNLCASAAAFKTVPEVRPGSINWFIGIFQTIITPVLAAIALAARQLAEISKSNEAKSGVGAFFKRAASRAMLLAVILALPLFLWLVYHRLVFWGLLSTATKSITAPFAPKWLAYLAAHSQVDSAVHAFSFTYFIFGLAGILFAFFAMLNPNSNSLHGLYRGRLANAFCTPFSCKDKSPFSALEPKYSPIHIVNTTLNVQSSEEVNKRGRDAEFFSFSRNYVGSNTTGYAATEKYEELEPALDMATAMAISGAAASSNMGSNALGRLRFTLALLNVRLGAWMQNPRVVFEKKMQLGRPLPTYFLQELLGKLDEKTSRIYLTDGGHIENLGVYELLRRRNKLIIVVEAEADPGMTFAALATLQRYARIDLGARIELSRSCVGQARPKAQAVHCALGSIDYGPDITGEKITGVLLYVKSSLSGDENDYITDYKRRNPDYPQETTADQLFDEEQFEVYRALGFHAMDGALTGKHLVQTTDKKLESLLDQSSVDDKAMAFRRLLGLRTSAKVPDHVDF